MTPDQVVVHSREHQQGRNGGEILSGVSIAEHHKLSARVNGVVCLATQLCEASLEPLGAVIGSIETRQCHGRLLAGWQTNVFDFGELIVINDGELDRNLCGVGWRGIEKITLWPQTARHRSHYLFPYRVQGRVGHLGELLGEVVEEQPWPVRDGGNGSVRAHSSEGLSSVLPHGSEQNPHLLLGISEGALATRDGGRGVDDVFTLGEFF